MSDNTEMITPNNNTTENVFTEVDVTTVVATPVNNTSEVVDDTKDIPDEPDCELPVVNPIKDAEFIEFPEEFLEEFDKAPWDMLSFEEYNASIEDPKFRIYYPTDFRRTCPTMKFDEPKNGSAPKADGSGDAKFTFSKIHEDDGKGHTSSCIVTSPAMHAPSGYKESDTGNGLVKSIKGILDFNNPHHRHFWFKTMTDVIRNCAESTLAFPGMFGLSSEVFGPDADKNSKKYKKALEAAINSFFELIRLPKIGEKEYDRTSTKRTFYINPLVWYNEKKKAWNNMKVYLPGSSEVTSLEALENICKGWIVKDGRVVMGKPKGFEFSVDLLITRIVRTSGNSIQVKGLSLYIHRFYKSERKGARETKQLQSLQGRLKNDFDRFLGLEGFKDETQKKENQQKPKFNPMSSSSESIPVAKAEVIPSDVPDQSQLEGKGKAEDTEVKTGGDEASESSSTKSVPTARKFSAFGKRPAVAKVEA